jgi:membrane protease YdiL (CAAX protease family)
LRASLLVVIDLALLVYLVLRPLPQVGYTFRLTGQDGRCILIALIAYGAVAIPLGLATGFLAFSLAAGDLIDWLLRWPIVYFFTALPEELLFRGLIQNQLRARLRNARATLGLTAVIFGLAHLNNPLPGFAVPNWTYALMAALAGIAYGWTWHRTNKITASAIVHASVNFTWAGFLSG